MDQSEILKFEQQTKLKLSEAIRIGAKLRPQCKQFFFSGGGSCAIGAAYEGATGRTDLADVKSMSAAGEKLRRLFGHDYANLAISVYAWNDTGMTREEIADRLEAMGY